MNFLETSLSWAMALNYLRERAKERKNTSNIPEKQPVLLLIMQFVGRALMIIGVGMQVAGKRLVKLGQGSAA